MRIMRNSLTLHIKTVFEINMYKTGKHRKGIFSYPSM